MDNLLAVFVILVILGFFASIGTGIVFLMMRSKTPGFLKKGFYSSVGIFLGALILMLVSLYSLDGPDEENVASKTQSNFTPDDVTNVEVEESPSVFSYDESSAFAEENGNFTLPIKVKSGYTAEIDEFDTVDEAELKEVGTDMYELTGSIDKGDIAGSYYIVFTKGNDTVGERIYIDNDLAYDPKLDTSVLEVATNDGYILDVEMDIEEVMGEYLKIDDEEVAVVEEVQVNDNAGKKDGSKLILIHLNTPMGLTSNKTQQKIDMQTLEITKAIYENPSIDFDIDSITYSWSVPIVDKEGTVENVFATKISLERKTLESLNYDRLKGIDVKRIADQYQSDIK